MQDNTGKWFVYVDGSILRGATGSGQNLNGDLQKNIGDELDALMSDVLGAYGVLVGLQAQTTTGLAVGIMSGTAFIGGQRVRQAGTATVALLPANTANIRIYISAGTPFNLTNRGWPAVFGYTTGSIGVDQLLLATVTTDGSGVTSLVDGRVFVGQLANAPSAAEKAAMAGTGVTAPSGVNRFVVNDDTRWQALTDLLATAAQYVTVNVPQILTAVHTFNPAAAGPPFLLGTNALGQLVPGFNAAQVGGETAAALHNAALLTGVATLANLPATVARTDVKNTFLSSQFIDPTVVEPPLQIGVRGVGQLVVGLNAEQVGGQNAAALHDAALLNGTVPDSALSTNIPKRTIANTFTAPQTIAPTTLTSPMILGSNAIGQKVVGWNADLLDGQEGAFYQNALNLTGTVEDVRLSPNIPRRDVQEYRVKISRTANQAIPNDSNYFALPFNLTKYNIGGMLPTGPAVTIQRTGSYLVSFSIAWENNTTGSFRGVRVLLNGNPIGPYIQSPVSALGGNFLSGAHLHQLVLGDVLQLQVAHNATSVIDVLAIGISSPEFAVHWLSG